MFISTREVLMIILPQASDENIRKYKRQLYYGRPTLVFIFCMLYHATSVFVKKIAWQKSDPCSKLKRRQLKGKNKILFASDPLHTGNCIKNEPLCTVS
uniref:Uncharacterized protein n=1 Tax=Rhizophagus irregularis (strain DAOM 181602 / DAOM 197198 / MUCL 43194) TaxID=747089 RepID=U9TBW9_RHIID